MIQLRTATNVGADNSPDDILDELYSVKDAAARQHDYDINRITAHFQAATNELRNAGHRVLSPPPPSAKLRTLTKQFLARQTPPPTPARRTARAFA